MLRPMTVHHSKSLFYDDGVLRHADLVKEVFELHRKSRHYSLKKGRQRETAMKINYINRQFVEEAFKLYKEAGVKMKLAPHPNYFVAICKRLYTEDLDKWATKKYNKEFDNSKNSNLGKRI